MEGSSFRPRVGRLVGVVGLGLAGILVLVTAYDAAHPVIVTPGFEARDEGLSTDAVVLPAFAAVYSLLASLVVLRSAVRPAFWFAAFAAALGAVVVFTLPSHFRGVGPLAVLAIALAAVVITMSAVGWFASPPVPDDPPWWPTHRG